MLRVTVVAMLVPASLLSIEGGGVVVDIDGESMNFIRSSNLVEITKNPAK